MYALIYAIRIFRELSLESSKTAVVLVESRQQSTLQYFDTFSFGNIDVSSVTQEGYSRLGQISKNPRNTKTRTKSKNPEKHCL